MLRADVTGIELAWPAWKDKDAALSIPRARRTTTSRTTPASNTSNPAQNPRDSARSFHLPAFTLRSFLPGAPNENHKIYP
jgi:hypothetical protein